jgi:hypothetical protein
LEKDKVLRSPAEPTRNFGHQALPIHPNTPLVRQKQPLQCLLEL